MAYFAEIDDNNIVVRVLPIPDEEEHRGQEYLADDMGFGGRWIQTSYNTRGGKHILGGTPFRMNFAGVGYTYDEAKDAFIEGPPVDPENYIFNEETLQWNPIPVQ